MIWQGQVNQITLTWIRIIDIDYLFHISFIFPSRGNVKN